MKSHSSYWQRWLWQVVRNEILPRLRETVARYRRYNKREEDNKKRCEELTKTNPLFTNPYTKKSIDMSHMEHEMVDEENERIEHDRWLAVEHNYL